MKEICVIGVGYVGLVTGAGFADLGNHVVCLNRDQQKCDNLKKGIIPIYEPGLEEIVRRNIAAGRLFFTTDYAEAMRDAELVFVAVGTPTGAEGEADLAFVQEAVEAVADVMTQPVVIINKSTVPIGTGDWVAKLVSKRTKVPFSVVSNPEFLREGSAVYDFYNPDRVVLGSTDPKAAEAVADIYRPLNCPILVTDLRTAEMIKYASNAFLATRISFINEMAGICEELGADVTMVARGMGMDKRIGSHFLNAGVGWGGSCFAGTETVFASNSPHVSTQSLAEVFAEAGESFQGDTVQVARPADKRVLAFDLETRRPALAQVTAVTRRPYAGTMVQITSSMGRTLRVTADHPVVVSAGAGLALLPAAEVIPGDQLLTLCELPSMEPVTSLNLIELLEGTALEADVHVSPTDGSFTQQYAQFARHIPPEMLRYPHEIKKHNRMPLRLFRYLSRRGVLHTSAEKLQLYTALGASTRINAILPVDADLLRLCGYYLAEGFISQDTGRAGAVRDRVGFSFHEDETEYVADVQRILTRWGLKFIERRGTHAVSTLVSSRIFAWLLRDVLKCGTRSSDKALPRLAFNVPPDLRYELLRGAFSGDGAVTTVQAGQNMMFEYATVSKPLADGLVLLMQTLGIVPSIRRRWMNKSKQTAYILRVSGYAQLDTLRDVFGAKHREKIAAVLAGYQRHIRQKGFTHQGSYAMLTVQDVAYEEVDTTVYSLETSTGTLIASAGLVCHNCFPKDVKALEYMASVHGCHPQLLRAVMDINRDQRRQVLLKLRAILGELDEKVIGIWGLSFKPNTDDMRDAPSLDIIHLLQIENARIKAYDPVAMDNARRRLSNVTFCDDPYAVAEGVDALVLVTEWNEFKQLDMGRVKAAMRTPVLIDGRNIYDPEEMRALGFTYRGVGRGYNGASHQE